MKEATDNNFDYLDGYDELHEDLQETVRRAFEQGHVDDEDWKGVFVLPQPLQYAPLTLIRM